MAQELPTFTIIGAGAIGSFIGVALHHVGFRVRFLLRPSASSSVKLQQLKINGLSISCSADSSFVQRIPAEHISDIFTIDAAACLTTCSYVIVATKRGANADVHRQLQEHGVQCPVLFMQNGLNVTSQIGPMVYEAIECVVYFNVTYKELGHATLAQSLSDALLVLDGRKKSSDSISKLFACTCIHTTVELNMRSVQCAKLITNMTNAVNALSGMPIANMLTCDASYRWVLAESIREAQEVFASNGDVPRAILHSEDLLLRWFVTILRLPQWLFNLTMGRKLEGRGEGFSSMAQDLIAGRVPTEVSYLNGEIVRLGKACGIATPVNDKLIDLVQMAEQANRGCPGISGPDLAQQVGLEVAPAPISIQLITLGIVGATLMAGLSNMPSARL